MSELTITNDNFEKEVLKNTKPVLVDFWAPWCGPCQMLGPIVEEVAKEVADKAVVAKLNVDDNQELAQKYGVSSIPTIIFFKNGEEADRFVGVRGKDELIKKLEGLS